MRKAMANKMKKEIKPKGFSGYSYRGKAFRTGKRVRKRTYKSNGKLTNYTISKRGIVTHFELRKELTGNNSEAVIIGHTSLPQKQTLMNLFRATMKYLLYKMSIECRDFGFKCVQLGFQAGDEFIISYYADAKTSGLTAIQAVVTGDNTIDQICAIFGQYIVNTIGFTALHESRIQSIAYLNRGQGS